MVFFFGYSPNRTSVYKNTLTAPFAIQMQSLNDYCFQGEGEGDSSKSLAVYSFPSFSAFDIANMGVQIALDAFTMLSIIAVGAMLTILSAPILFFLK